MTRKNGAVPRQLSTAFQRRGDPGADRRATPREVFDQPGRGRRAGFRGPGRAPRPDGPARLPRRASDLHETEDAFQATFLILVQKARSLWVQDSLGPWLHQVALRTASCARSAAARRRRHEQRAGELAASFAKQHEGLGGDVEKLLHDEINGYPSATACQSCCATSRATRARRQRGGWAGQSERSRVGVLEAVNACAADSRGAASHSPSG